ncbi:MAG: HNH endonuclease [Dehalococcoidia bacterium]|jgi:hypothetical protein
MKRIPLTRGQYALVDDDDYEWLRQWDWYAEPKSAKFYAARSENRHKVYMHRELCEGMMVDHIDGDSLNNQRGNLRAATPQQNTWNSRKPKKRSCEAAFKYNGIRLRFGTYDTPEEAAEVEDYHRKRLQGEFARGRG